MVLAKTSSDIISIRGRFGGVYFKRGSPGTHIQAMPRTVNYQRTPLQITGINPFSLAAQFWMMILVAGFALLWAAFAALYFFVTKTGEKKKISGYNWYIHYALRDPEYEHPPFWKPPKHKDVLPHFLVCYRGMWTYSHAPKDWPADCCSGYYWKGVPYNNTRSYRTEDSSWFLWWETSHWIISPGLGQKPGNFTFYGPEKVNGAHITGKYHNPVTAEWAQVYRGIPV